MQNTVESPAVGMLATVTIWTDCYPARVIAVSPSGHQVTLQRLDATVSSGSVVDGSAEYSISETPRADAPTDVATRRGNGVYRLKGWQSGGRVNFGFARAYSDPSF